jgi:hypothetical protein
VIGCVRPDGGVGGVILGDTFASVVVALCSGVEGVMRSCLRGREGDGVRRAEAEGRTAGEAREASEGPAGRIMSKN